MVKEQIHLLFWMMFHSVSPNRKILYMLVENRWVTQHDSSQTIIAKGWGNGCYYSQTPCHGFSVWLPPIGRVWKRSHEVNGPASSQKVYCSLPSNINALCGGHNPDLVDGESEGGRGFWLCHSLLMCINLRKGRELSSHTAPCALEQTLLLLRQVEFFSLWL